MTARKVHLGVNYVCISVMTACKLKWLMQEDFETTEDELKVTCEKCLKKIKEWGDEYS